MNAITPFLANEIASLERVRTETLKLVEGLSQEEFDWSPARDKWSIGEVLDHLLLAEQFFQRDLERFAEGARAGQPTHIRHTFRDLDIGLPLVPRSLLPVLELPLSLATAFLPAAALNVLTGARLFPMKNPSVAEPRRGRPAEALRQELWDSCGQTIQFLQQLSPSDASRMTVSHPMLGTRTVPELIRFVIEHERRHQGQVVNLKERLMRIETGSARWDGSGRTAAVSDRRAEMLKPTTVAWTRREEVNEQDAIRGV
jgi:uncharacterized damage-inducible protein DinB